MFRTLSLLFVILISACSPTGARLSPPEADVLASTTFLADIAQNVAGDRLQVKSLLPAGADPHSYEPIPQDLAEIADSMLIILNGAGYERFLGNVLENAGGERTVIEASAGLDVREDAGGGHGIDPHLWLDPNLVVSYVENIREGFITIDPEGADVYRSNASVYIDQLQELDTWTSQQVASIPPEQRMLVTNHESLGYFAERYGFEMVGTVVPGFSSESAPSAQQMAALIDQIKASGAPAVFLDAGDAPTLAQQIASETGVTVITDLYIESLTDGPPADTYIHMIQHNVTRIVEGLK